MRLFQIRLAFGLTNKHHRRAYLDNNDYISSLIVMLISKHDAILARPYFHWSYPSQAERPDYCPGFYNLCDYHRSTFLKVLREGNYNLTQNMLKTLHFRGHDKDHGLLMSTKAIVNDIVQQSNHCNTDVCNQLYLSLKAFSTTYDFEPIRIEPMDVNNVASNSIWYYHSEYSDGLFVGEVINAQTSEGEVIDMGRLFPKKMPGHIITGSYVIYKYPYALEINFENPFYREGLHERVHYNAKELRKKQTMHNDVVEKYEIFINEVSHSRSRNRIVNRRPIKSKLQRYTTFL